MPGYDIKLTPDSPVGGAFRLRVAAQLDTTINSLAPPERGEGRGEGI
jgi:hypothetical protein